jgi:hypothetical protein
MQRLEVSGAVWHICIYVVRRQRVNVLKILYFNIKMTFRKMGCNDVKLIQDGVHLWLIHTCHAALLPFSDSAVSFMKVRVVARNIRTASPTVLTNWWVSDNNLCGTLCGSWEKPNASRPPTCRLWTANANSHGMVVAWHGHGMCESNTARLCKSNGKDTI